MNFYSLRARMAAKLDSSLSQLNWKLEKLDPVELDPVNAGSNWRNWIPFQTGSQFKTGKLTLGRGGQFSSQFSVLKLDFQF